MPAPAEAIRTYILAKDGNRPFLMKEAFAEDAELETVVKSDAISFPSAAKGLGTLEDVLVRRFCVDNENIFTFCLSEPSEGDRSRFQCHWLVGMSMKATGQLRVGCGSYDWHFDGHGKIAKLVISIDVMKILPADELASTMRWLSCLPYPWCSPGQTLQSIPSHEGFAEIAAYLKQFGPISGGA
jgi:hypothetical protein